MQDIATIQTALFQKGYHVRLINWQADSVYYRPSIVFDMADQSLIEPVSNNAAAYTQDWQKQILIIEFPSWLERDKKKFQNANYLNELAEKVLYWISFLPNKLEQKMRIYNVSKDKVNYSQRNNEVNPNKSCNTTSMTMAASYMPKIWELFINSPIYKNYAKKFEQPEDCLQQFILDNKLRPTYHDDLSKAFNDFVGKNVTKFSMSVPIATLVAELKEGRPVVISGDFPKADGKTLGHIVCLVGCVFNNDNKTEVPDYWIIDDPYGDTLNDWQGSGNDIKLTNEFFMKYIKEKGKSRKWAHIFSEV